MKINNQINFIEITKSAISVYSLIADGQYRSTSLGRDKWKSLVGPDASLQFTCNKEGFNAECTMTTRSKARIGILANEDGDCHSCNSRIGFGTAGRHDDSNTCGNIAKRDADNGDQLIKAFGYILVQWETSSQELLADHTLYLTSDLSSVSPLLYWPETICENMVPYCCLIEKKKKRFAK